MADATLRGRFELSAEGAIRDLHSIRDAGVEGDASLEALGRRMDELSRKRITPRIELAGFDRVNVQLSELERRLDRFDRRRVSAHVGIGGGFSNFAGGGMGGGGPGGGGGMFSSLGGIPGMLPWWAMAAPLAPTLLGGAGALIGSAGAGALGAGVLGLGGMGALGAGAIPTALVARNAVKDLGAVTKAQTAYNNALQAFGQHSTQAAAAKRRLDLALVSAPAGAAGAARQVSGLESAFHSATRPAYTAIYRTIAQGAFDVRRAMPQLAPLVNRSASVTGAAVSDYAGFLTNQQSLRSYRQLVAGFAQDLPPIERSAQSLTRLFLNLSTDALPFFHEGTVWLQNWTRHMANQSQDQAAVQRRMRELVGSARDWEHLLGAAGRDLRDLFAPSVAPGNSMVVTFTHTLDRWDTWLRDNPGKVRQFFDDGVRGTERIATVIGNLTKDVWQIFQALSPIFTRAEQFLSFASGLGGGSLLTGAGVLFAGYGGARRALGGRGPSAGGLASSFILGGSPMRAGGGAVVGAPAAERAALSAGPGSYLLPPPGWAPGAMRTQARLSLPSTYLPAGVSPAESQMALFGLGARGYTYRGAAMSATAARGEVAFQHAYGGVEGARYALPQATMTRADLIAAGRIQPTLLERAAPAIGGAARSIAPILIGLSVLQGIGAATASHGGVTHAINAGVSATASALTLGAVPASTFQHVFHAAFGTDQAGASLGNAAVRGNLRGLVNQANAVRTPTQLRAVQSSAQQVRISGFEMSPGDQRKLDALLRTVLATAASNAGGAAATSWEDSLTRGITSMGPNRAVTTALRGMSAQVRQLGPQGAKAFASDEAQWAQQMMAANPSLQKPLTRLMGGIVDDINKMTGAVKGSFRDMHREVFYFNGQILQGSATTWQAIGKALTDPASVAQERLSGIFKQIQAEAVNALTSMGYSPSAARSIVMNLGKPSSATHQAGDIARNTLNLSQGKQVAGTVMTSTGSNIYLAPTGRRHERGGMIPGRGLLDTVRTPDGGLAAPGEAYIANRHTMMDLSRATVSMYGKTAWQMIRDEHRAHSAPSYRAARGAVVMAGGHRSGWVQAQHPELHPGVAQAVEDVLNRFPLSITSTTSGGHVSGSYHYLGEAADIAGPSSTMYSAAQWIKSSGLARGLTEGIHNPNLAVKYGQVQSPPGVFGSVWAGHLNHIHMAVAGALRAGVAGGAGGARGMAASVRLRAPQSGMAGVPGALADRASQIYAGALQQHVNQHLGGTAGAGGFTGGGSARANQQLGRRMMLSWGWPASEWPSLLSLWNQESGWMPVTNPSSGAAGIPQALGHGHPFGIGDIPGQIAWGLNYIRGRYGSPSGAWAHERSHNWYQRGGQLNFAGWNAAGGDYITHGPTMFGAGEKGRERVTITPLGRGGGGRVVVNFYGPVYARDHHEVNALGEMVAAKILDALDRVGAGTSDGELMAGAA